MFARGVPLRNICISLETNIPERGRQTVVGLFLHIVAPLRARPIALIVALLVPMGKSSYSELLWVRRRGFRSARWSRLFESNFGYLGHGNEKLKRYYGLILCSLYNSRLFWARRFVVRRILPASLDAALCGPWGTRGYSKLFWAR